MGYYIATPQPKYKADQLLYMFPEIKEIQREEISKNFDGTFKNIIICVMENGPFDAAGICYSLNELNAFAFDDGRKKRWLIAPRGLVTQLNKSVTNVLPI